MLGQDRPHEELLDEVYGKYADSDPFLPITRFIDHSTMGAEALVELGAGDLARSWIARHPVRPYLAPVTGIPIPSGWKQALGKRECHGDWIRHFDTELASRPFQAVLAEWVGRFAHDVGAFLFHGLIRTAHAARALVHKDTPARRTELARGLSLWAIGIHTAPPESPLTTRAGRGPEIEILHYARLGAVSFIPSPDVPKLHLVTGPMAYLMLLPFLETETHWLAEASFNRTHREAAQRFEALKQKAYAAPNGSVDRARLVALAAQKDAHPSKLTEAALRAYEKSKDELFLKAAGKALDLHNARALLGVLKAVLLRRGE